MSVPSNTDEAIPMQSSAASKRPSNAPSPSTGSKRVRQADAPNEVESNQTPNEVESNQTPNDVVDVQSMEQPKDAPNSRLKSEYWGHFDRVKDITTGKYKAECKYCHKKICGETSMGTTHLRKHFQSCVLRRTRDIRQTILNPKRGNEGKTLLTNYSFDQQEARMSLGKMIILHEYPLQIVEHHGFRDFCNKLQPLFKHVSRNTVKADIMKIYEHEKGKTMELLSNNESRFSVTTDMWTSSNKKRGFMAITVHFVDNSWNLQSRIVRFIYVPCPHTSDVLSQALLECLMDWNIDCKLSTLTLDNCSTNDAMINNLLDDKLSTSTLLLGGKLFHMRCSAHILNLIVKEGLDVIRSGIERVRDSVAYWTATPKRCEKFELVCQQLKIPCKKMLSLDCKTRWNSTYLMLQSVLPFKDVFERLSRKDHQYKSLPSEDDWLVASEICTRLQLFYEATELFSGTKYPTINLFFPKIFEIKKAMKHWESSMHDEVRMMAMNMETKFNKYWSDIHGVMALGFILDPRFKMKGIEFYYPRLFDRDVAFLEIEKVHKLAYDIVKEYQESVASGQGASVSVSSSQSQKSVSESTIDDYDLFVSSTISSNDLVKSEMDYYLEEPVIPRVQSLDILAWWKSNSPKYPTLSKIARDLLAIPVSTVASESAFSTSGRFLTPHRSRLHPKTLEALMCAQDWLWMQVQGDSSTGTSFARASLNEEFDYDVEEEDGSVITDAMACLS